MKKTKTWIIICINLQLFLHCFGKPCGNPITDAVNDIPKLVGNIPNDYNMSVRYVPEKDGLPKHCWLYMMVVEMTRHLSELLRKFDNTSQNHLIIDNLSKIFKGIRGCINDEMDFDSASSLYRVEVIKARDFFSYVTSTIEVFKEINDTEYSRLCILPQEYEFEYSTEDDFLILDSNHDLPYVPSTRKNSSRYDSSARSGFSTGTSIQYSTVLIALACLVIGFLLGVLCLWKFKHRQTQTQDNLSAVAVEPRAENESRHILQLAKIISV